MPFNSTRLRAGGAEPACPAHGHRSGSCKQNSNVNRNPAPHLTAGALASLAKQEKSQFDTWYEEQHTHEQLAVGEDTSRAGGQIERFFKDVERNVDDKTK